MKLFIFTALCLMTASFSVARPMWGPTGHQVTASVASMLISKNTAAKVSEILSGETLTDVATWADEVKHESQWEWSAALHFINCPSWACKYNPATDCVNNVCVAGAILNYTNLLATSSDAYTRNISLRFLTHFCGDIHQPLHVGFAADRGGNDIKGTFNGYHDNLHEIWDTYMLEEHINTNFSGDQNSYVEYLYKSITGAWAGEAKQWAECPNESDLSCPDGWANESAGLACTRAYVDSTGDHIVEGFDLGTAYYNFTKSTIDEQLARGGVRLAATLDKIFSS